jgi:hemerythrin-like domain-containing protein
MGDHDKSRRIFLTSLTGAGAAALGLGLGALTKRVAFASEEQAAPSVSPELALGEETPLEDLMREHAVLERVLLIYEEGARRLEAGKDIDSTILARAAGIVHRYIEEHHERDEERYIFPRLVRAGIEVDLVQTLLAQHEAGRRLTADILRLTSAKDAADRQLLVRATRSFARMYRPHAARENTVLFPALRKAVSEQEYVALHDALESRERAEFGPHLYETILGEVGKLEHALGIDDLTTYGVEGVLT